MKLSPLVLDDMFIKRFKYDGKMNSLTNIKIKDQNNFYTYDNIINRLMNSDAKELFNQISGGNARFACNMMRRLLESNQLKGLDNLGKKQYTIAALMLTDETQSDESAPIINLFNNKEGHDIGNFLIRYRVLEYFYHELSSDPGDIRYKNYFKMLGYDINRVKKVLERMLMASILYSTKGLTPSQFEDTSIDNVGTLKITQTGKTYFDILLKEVWYYIAAKHEMIENVRKDYLTTDEAKSYVYMTHKDFSGILKNDEDEERIKIGHFNVKHGEIIEYYSLKQPSQIALNVLRSK